MDLDTVLRKYPGVSLARDEDNREILNFFGKSEMNTSGLGIAYDRSPNFFDFLKLQSKDFLVFCAKTDSQKLTGVASIALRKGYIGGELRLLGYLGDLRIAFDRRLLSQWRNLYGELLSPVTNHLQGVEYLLTAVLDQNIQAFRALIQPKNGDYQYEKLCSYNIVQVFAWPFRKLKKLPENEDCCVANSEDESSLLHFMSEIQKKCLFGYDLNSEAWKVRKREWGISTEDFHVFKKDGKIQACVALWSPEKSKRIVMASMPKMMRVGVALWNTLLPSLKLPKQGETLRTQYLTHLNFGPHLSREERQRCFVHLFDSVYRKIKEKPGERPHCIAFADFEGFAKKLKFSARFELGASLYSVRHVGTDSIEKILAESEGVGFEMALV